MPISPSRLQEAGIAERLPRPTGRSAGQAMVRAGAAGALLAALGETDLRAASCSDLWVEMEAKTNAFAADVESGATGGMCNATTPPPGCARAETRVASLPRTSHAWAII